MKKLCLTVLVAFAVITVTNAQELKSKKDVPFLPEAGDYALGIDATPIFNFFGNFIKINSGAPFADPAAWNFINNSAETNNAIWGKYFVDEKTAYRANFRIQRNSTTTKTMVDDALAANLNDTFVNIAKKSYFNIVLGAGIEKHRGKGRLVGIYGAEALFCYGKGVAGTENEKHKYGEALNANFAANTTRPLFVKQGATLGIGVRGFVGVEYFFAPKISVGGEFGWGILLKSTGKGKTKDETWSGTTVVTTETETDNSWGGENVIDTDNLTGCINLIFHF